MVGSTRNPGVVSSCMTGLAVGLYEEDESRKCGGGAYVPKVVFLKRNTQ